MGATAVTEPDLYGWVPRHWKDGWADLVYLLEGFMGDEATFQVWTPGMATPICWARGIIDLGTERERPDDIALFLHDDRTQQPVGMCWALRHDTFRSLEFDGDTSTAVVHFMNGEVAQFNFV